MGTIAILNLPVGSALLIDGYSMILKREDFVGVSNVPCGDFHLVTVQHVGTATMVHGFVIYEDQANWLLARTYDPTTEEVSTTDLDEMTRSNLHLQIQSNQIDAHRIVEYPRLIATQQWKHATCYVSRELLRMRGFRHGDKILPGAYDGEHDESQPLATAGQTRVDGSSITCPSIPCIDRSMSIHKEKHRGTRQYLSGVLPGDRSALFLAADPAEQALKSILEKEYNHEWNDLLGDLQLAFVLFINLQCFSSLEHWRDLIAMLSLVQSEGISERSSQYARLLEVLQRQLLSVETNFFEDIEYSGENFFVPALKRLCLACSNTNIATLENAANAFMKMARERFVSAFVVENEELEGIDFSDVDFDDEDAPVVVSLDDMEASMARQTLFPVKQEYPDAHKRVYPLLFASMQLHEDIVMTCARVLDEKVDVSVVREAAAYLEQVEAKK